MTSLATVQWSNGGDDTYQLAPANVGPLFTQLRADMVLVVATPRDCCDALKLQNYLGKAVLISVAGGCNG